MTPAARAINIGAVIVPFVAFVVAVVTLWSDWVGWFELAVLAVGYLVTGFGITIGYHRMLTHRAFRAKRPVELGLAIAGSTAVQGPVIEWVADHRKHHAHTDQEGDPHSPHVGGGKGLRGLLHAHMGWLWTEQGKASKRKYAPELMEDAAMRRVSKLFPVWVLLSLALPALAGLAYHGDLKGLAMGLLWGGLVRIFLLHHVTWSINSLCHFLGTRRFALEDESRNLAVLALPSLGEAWHNNHHAFPRAAVQGLRRHELDPSGWVVTGMEKLGLVEGVVRITPERQAAKLAKGERVPA